MKPFRVVSVLSILVSLSGLAGPALAQDPASPHLRRVEAALTEWIASGGKAPLALPDFLQASVRALPPAGAPLAPGYDPMVSVIVRTTDPEMLRMSGAKVRTVAGNVVTADIPLSLLRELGSMPGLIAADVPHRLRPTLDVSRPEIRADVAQGSAQPPYPGTTGKGVVVGVIDTGIDVDHGDFTNADATTRIIHLWDQTDNGGPNPTGYAYGTEWTEANINAGATREKDTDGHGTHVTGIAAGNGRAASSPSELYDFAGIAPEADIIFVKTTFAEDAIIDAVAWIQSRAGAEPSAINLSLGSQYGAHDGTSNLDAALAALSGPGKIIVAAAGNEGGSQIHAQVTVPASSVTLFPINVPTYTATGGAANDLLLIEGYSSGSNFSVSVITPNSTTVGPVSSSGSVTTSTAQGEVDIQQGLDPANGDRALLIDIWDKNITPPASGTWNIRVQNNQTSPRSIELWIYYVQLGSVSSVRWSDLTQITNSDLVSSPASSDSVIAVGAYVTKTSWPCVQNGGGMCTYSPPGAYTIGDIAPFSSPGPLRNGTAKPEISAPGMGIASSLSKDATSSLFTNNGFKLPGGLHYVSQGTSQSTPHVTGVAALILERRPTAAFRQVSLAMTGTARHDAFTPAGFGPLFGWGKVDAAAAVQIFVPVRLLSFTAGWEEGHAVLRWDLRETEEGASFQVERGPTATGPFSAQSAWLQGNLSFSWIDPAPDAGQAWYRLVTLDRAGSRQILGTTSLAAPRVVLSLLPNAPNPFHASTVIAFELGRPAPVSLDVLDLSGRVVTTLISGVRAAGRNEITWEGMDGTGRRVAAGIYFFRLTTPEGVLARRMVLAS
jgi:minor extracellular serine protease Vpr